MCVIKTSPCITHTLSCVSSCTPCNTAKDNKTLCAWYRQVFVSRTHCLVFDHAHSVFVSRTHCLVFDHAHRVFVWRRHTAKTLCAWYRQDSGETIRECFTVCMIIDKTAVRQYDTVLSCVYHAHGVILSLYHVLSCLYKVRQYDSVWMIKHKTAVRL